MVQSPYRTLPRPSIMKGDMLMSEKLHDLTILYLQKSDISNLTPEQLFGKYNEVYNQMKAYQKSNKDSNVAVLK